MSFQYSQSYENWNQKWIPAFVEMTYLLCSISIILLFKYQYGLKRFGVDNPKYHVQAGHIPQFDI
jgi:hypothetical protein